MITDFVIELDGVVQFTVPSWIKDSDRPRGIEQYFNRRKSFSEPRVYFMGFIGTKSVGDLKPVSDEIIASMKKQAGGALHRDGVLCIFGSSNGAAMALAVAAAAQTEMRVQYICLADLPLFAGGRNPGIPNGIGNVAPTDPQMIRRATSLAGSITVQVEGDRPQFQLVTNINAKKKQNFFQHAGNNAKVGTFSGRWFWTSDMKNHEVHGFCMAAGWEPPQEISGFRLQNPTADAILGQTGDNFHQQLDDFVTDNIWRKTFPSELAKFDLR